MKAGAFKTIGNHFELDKLAQHTHLYTSDKLINDFPGRIFEINNIADYQKKEMKKLGITNVKISVRNFPDATNLNNKPILILTKKKMN